MELQANFDWSGLPVRFGLVAQALTGEIGPAEIVDIVVSQGMAGLGATGAHAGVVQGDYLHPIAAIGTSAEVFRQMGALTLDRSIPTCLAVRTGEPVWITDRQEGLALLPDLAVAPLTARAWAALPLVVGGRPFGALGLSFEREMVFDAPEREWLGALTNVAALALSRWCVVPPGGMIGDDVDPVSVELNGLLSIARLEGVLVMDADGLIVKVNDRLCEMFGYQSSALVGQQVEVLVPIDGRAAHVGRRNSYLGEPGPRPMGGGAALRGRRFDGSTFPIDVSLSPCATSLGLHVLVVVRDEGLREAKQGRLTARPDVG